MFGDTDVRIRSGTYPVDEMLTAHAVSALPAQTDQGNVPWFIVSDGRIMPAELHIALDNTAKEHGGTIYQWRWGILTPDMFDYVRTTYLAGGWSGEITIRDWNRLTKAWEVYNCKAILQHPRDQEMQGGGWVNYEMDLYELTAAAAS